MKQKVKVDGGKLIQTELNRLMKENDELEQRLIKATGQISKLQSLAQAIQTNIIGNNGAIQSLNKISQQNAPLTPLNPGERKKKVKEKIEEKQKEETENENK